MSDESGPAAATDGALQFDTAEVTTPTEVMCINCKRLIGDRYWTLNGKNFCQSCRTLVEKHYRGPVSWQTWLKVLGQGGLAAALGTVIYFAVLKITGYELGLIAIVVGVLVGTAVRKASGARGGLRFQTAAVALTYASIVSAYIPTVFEGLQSSVHAKKAGATASTGATPAGDSAEGAEGTAEAEAPPATTEPAGAKKPTGIWGNPVFAIVAFGALMFVFAAFAPFLAGFQNFMGWIIIGIALYQAWKLNSRVPLNFIGPIDIPAALPIPVPVAEPAATIA